MKKIICWFRDHDWFNCWRGTKIRYQEGMVTFQQRSCRRCGKTERVGVKSADSPLPPFDCNQRIKWKNYASEYGGEK